MTKKRIAIDVSPLYDGNSIRGVGHYTKHLVESLQKELKTNPDYKQYQIDLIEKPGTDLKEYQLVHYPYFDPFKLTLPKKQIPTIVTVHDLIPREHKKHFPVGIKGEIKWLLQKNKLKKVDYIITPSHYSKYVIHNLINYPDDQIYVTYEAAPKEFKPINDKKLLDKIKKKYQLPNKFILFVGDINWNKNIPNLVKACLSLKYPLVIVGSAATKKDVPEHPWTKDLHWLQQQIKKHPKLLIPTGFVPDEDLPAIFNLATIYSQASFAEGFGLPLVEAMQSGTPLVYSVESCLNEIVDYNGVFFDPTKVSHIKNTLKAVWNSPELQKDLSQKGLQRAKIFDWKLTALQTLAVYDLVLKYEG